MTAVDLSLLIAALIVATVSLHLPRALLWLGTAGLSFVVSTVYWRTGWPYAEAVGGFADAGVCLAIYFWAKERWELLIWRLFQTSVAINFLYLAGNLGVFPSVPHDIFSSMLEAINWLTLLLIGGMGVMQRAGLGNAYARRPWDRIRGALLALRRERTEAPFYKIP